MKKNDSNMKKLSIVTLFISKNLCTSLLLLTNPFVNTKAYPIISLGTTPSTLNSTFFDWTAVNLS